MRETGRGSCDVATVFPSWCRVPRPASCRAGGRTAGRRRPSPLAYGCTYRGRNLLLSEALPP